MTSLAARIGHLKKLLCITAVVEKLLWGCLDDDVDASR
jgi:hypothetical protein